jgi:hypothetical protein
MPSVQKYTYRLAERSRLLQRKCSSDQTCFSRPIVAADNRQGQQAEMHGLNQLIATACARSAVEPSGVSRYDLQSRRVNETRRDWVQPRCGPHCRPRTPRESRQIEITLRELTVQASVLFEAREPNPKLRT